MTSWHTSKRRHIHILIFWAFGIHSSECMYMCNSTRTINKTLLSVTVNTAAKDSPNVFQALITNNLIIWTLVIMTITCFYTPDLSGRIMVWRGCLSVRLSTKLVNTIQTEPLKLGPSNLVHLLPMTRGRTLLIFKVRGRRSHVTH